jgi:enolase
VPRIGRIHAREVFDSRGRPTLEVEVHCEGARPGRAIVPSGASTGKFEAWELRDGNEARLQGLGVKRAVSHVRGEIAAHLTGFDAEDQQELDRRLCELDGTENKSRLGANAILGVSLASAYGAAEAKNQLPVRYLREIWQRVPSVIEARPAPAGVELLRRSARPVLPLPMVNMISGGLHAGGQLDVQDFLILPVGAESYRQAMDWIITIYWKLGELLQSQGYEGRLVGDEGGYGPKLPNNEAAIEFVMEAIRESHLVGGRDVAIGLDVASTHFYRDGQYHLTASHRRLDAEEMISYLEHWVERFGIIVSIEDGLAEDDWEGWNRLTERLGDRVQLIGDDLFVTNSSRLQRGIAEGVGNSVLIKLNQIGTLWETLETLRLALDAGYWPVISARSGETEDATIADLAVATGAGQIKVGSVARSERLAKYNHLLRLDEALAGEADYLGGKIFKSLWG